MRLPEWLVPFFALPAVTFAELGVESADPHATIHPAYTTLLCLLAIARCCTLRRIIKWFSLLMGWSHSVLLAQAAHEHVMRRGCMYER